MIHAQGISYLPYADGSWKHMVSAPTFPLHSRSVHLTAYPSPLLWCLKGNSTCHTSSSDPNKAKHQGLPQGSGRQTANHRPEPLPPSPPHQHSFWNLYLHPTLFTSIAASLSCNSPHLLFSDAARETFLKTHIWSSSSPALSLPAPGCAWTGDYFPSCLTPLLLVFWYAPTHWQCFSFQNIPYSCHRAFLCTVSSLFTC